MHPLPTGSLDRRRAVGYQLRCSLLWLAAWVATVTPALLALRRARMTLGDVRSVRDDISIRLENTKNLLEFAHGELVLQLQEESRDVMTAATEMIEKRVGSRRWSAPVNRSCRHKPIVIRSRSSAVDRCDFSRACNYTEPNFWKRCPPCIGQRLFTTAGAAESVWRGTRRASRLLPERDWPLKPFASCALVGYGKGLSGTGCGKEIDMHQAVFRTNCLPALGDLPADVGARVDIDFWNVGTIKSLLKGSILCSDGVTERQGKQEVQTVGARPFAATRNRVAFLTDANNTKFFEEVLSSSRVQALSKAIPMLQLHHSSDFWKADITQLWFGQLGLPGAPTSGWGAVMAALGLCREVALYGYRSPPSSGGVWAWDGHDIEAEHLVWGALDDKTIVVEMERNRHWGLGGKS